MSDLLRLRLRNQRLTGPALATPAAVVGWFGAVQAQEIAAARWAVALRTEAATERDVERVCDAGAVVRTHVLRPTWHFVLAEDLRWMLALSAPHVKRSLAYHDRTVGLDERTARRAVDAVTRALAGTALTRPELGRALAKAKITASGQRLGNILIRAELDAVICSGPRRGKLATYALVDERCPKTPAIDRDEALGRIATRYATAHGPVRLEDLAWWAGLTARDAARAIDIAKLATREFAGERHYLHDAAAPRAAATLHLLPAFDEYLVAYRHRGATVHDAVAASRGPSIGLLAKYVVVKNGQAIGIWQRTLGRAGVTLETELVEPAPRAALARQVARYGRFLELPARLSEPAA